MSLPTCQTCIYAKGICKKTGVEIRPTTGCSYHTPKPITNADRIRSMSDEELAEWITELTDCAVYPYTRKDAPRISIGQTCAASWLDWLRQEAKDD